MRKRSAPAQSDRADRWSRRSVMSSLTAVGIALVSGRSGATDVGGERTCRAVIDTALGPIGVTLELGRAPISAGDFLKYVDRGLYAGGAFYRTVRPDDDAKPIKIDVVQGGLTDEKKFLAPIAHEPTNRTGLRHRNGTISIARRRGGYGNCRRLLHMPRRSTGAGLRRQAQLRRPGLRRIRPRDRRNGIDPHNVVDEDPGTYRVFRGGIDCLPSPNFRRASGRPEDWILKA
jgi:hypothetical protein